MIIWEQFVCNAIPLLGSVKDMAELGDAGLGNGEDKVKVACDQLPIGPTQRQPRLRALVK